MAHIRRAEHQLSEVRPLLGHAVRCLTAGLGTDVPATVQARSELAQSL
jgi:hypothetical protein